MPLDNCISGHREPQALQKSLVKITTPLVLQRRLVKITTKRISLPEAWQFGNKRPSANVALKSSQVSFLEEWAFASSVIFLYLPWSKSWKILSCSGLRIDRNSRPLYFPYCASAQDWWRFSAGRSISMETAPCSIQPWASPQRLPMTANATSSKRAVVLVVWAPVH